MSASQSDWILRATLDARTSAVVTMQDAHILRRAQLTLHRWAEEECNGTIQRRESDGRPEHVAQTTLIPSEVRWLLGTLNRENRMSTQPTITEFGVTGLKKSTAQKDIRTLATEIGTRDHSTEDDSILAAWLRVDVETLYDRRSVARKFPAADRDRESDYLTYSHYHAPCGIEDRDERIRWRDRAATERIPVAKLRSLLAGTGNLADDATRPARTPQSRKGSSGRKKAETSSQNETRGFNPVVSATIVDDGAPIFTPPAETVPVSGRTQGNPLIVLPRALCDRLYQLGGNYEGALAEAIRRIEQSFAMPQPSRRGEYLEARS